MPVNIQCQNTGFETELDRVRDRENDECANSHGLNPVNTNIHFTEILQMRGSGCTNILPMSNDQIHGVYSSGP
jgi:hypothetical protein